MLVEGDGARLRSTSRARIRKLGLTAGPFRNRRDCHATRDFVRRAFAQDAGEAVAGGKGVSEGKGGVLRAHPSFDSLSSCRAKVGADYSVIVAGIMFYGIAPAGCHGAIAVGRRDTWTYKLQVTLMLGPAETPQTRNDPNDVYKR